jgi:xylulokinase
LSSQEWLSWRLGADPVPSIPSEAYRPIYWDDGQLGIFGLEKEKFPPFVKMGTLIGKVSAEAAARCPLPEGIPIAAGSSDFITALIGTGTLEAGMVCGRAGSSEGINVCGALPVQDAALRVLPHAVEGLWNIGALIPVSGRLFDWYRALTGQDGLGYGALLAGLIPEKPEARPPRFFPCFAPDASVNGKPGVSSPDIPDKIPRGKPRGIFPQRNLLYSGSHTLQLFWPSCAASYGVFDPKGNKTELGRAVLETIGFRVREALETLKRAGFTVGEMRCSGGQCKSPLWIQYKADLSGCTLHIPEIEDAELAGDAVLAALALGRAPDIRQGAGMIRIKKSYSPRPGTEAFYRKRFEQYMETRGKLSLLYR